DIVQAVSAGGDQPDMDGSAVDDEKLVRAAVGQQCIAETGQGVNEGETFALIETYIELVTVQHIKSAFVVEARVGHNIPKPAARKTEKDDRANPVPAGQDVRHRLHLSHRCDVQEGTEVRPRLVVSRESHRDWNDRPSLPAICAMRGDTLSDERSKKIDVIVPC